LKAAHFGVRRPPGDRRRFASVFSKTNNKNKAAATAALQNRGLTGTDTSAFLKLPDPIRCSPDGGQCLEKAEEHPRPG
jgi:hypothetical protein